MDRCIQTAKEKLMMLQRKFRHGAIICLIALFAAASTSAYAQPAEHNVPAGIKLSKDLGRVDPSQEINITVHLKLNDRAAFDKAVDALYDPASPTYHQWMTNADLRKYAPSEAQRESVRQELERHGMTILESDHIGFTVRAHGTIGQVEEAFNTEIHQFEFKGRTYRANIRDARLNGVAGDYVGSVAGLESHEMRPLAVRAVNPSTQKPFPSVALQAASEGFPSGINTTDCLSASTTFNFGSSLPTATYTGTVYDANGLICDYIPSQLWDAYGLNDVFANGYNGAGQTIALVEGYGYPTLESDANAFAQLGGLPKFTSTNFSMIYPEGKPNPELGIIEGWNIEIALDIDWSHTVAPGANILEVITYGQDNEDFQYSIQYVVDNNLANQLSNSYEEDLDLIAGALEQESWNDTLEVATAKGISVNFSTGDGGDNGVGSPVGSPLIPSDSPNATGVGGTSVLNDVYNPGSTITTVWGDTLTYLLLDGSVADPPLGIGLIGGGGGGQSVYWPKPSWQGSKVPGTHRAVPDVSALADPYTGVPIVITVGTTQYIEYGWGGTSLASPIFTGFWALANEKAGGGPLGQGGRVIASLPYGTVQDVLPTTDSSVNNVAGSITDSSGTTAYSDTALFAGFLYTTIGFTSTVWELDPYYYLDFGFGIDSSLTVTRGWDDATGFGTPYGLDFLNKVTAAVVKK
jgi:subtilase family serine protease